MTSESSDNNTKIPPAHGCYGVCPECGNDHTIIREGSATRLCLTCGYDETFESQDAAMTGWKAMPPAERARLYPSKLNPILTCKSAIPLYKHEGD